MSHYDEHYSKGGFKYSASLWQPRISKLVQDLGIEGRVLDAPCGNGFWSKLLRKAGQRRQTELGDLVRPLQVVSSDLSEVGCSKCNGIRWDLRQLNIEWVNQFDWVFCRGPSELHHKNIDTIMFSHISKYAPNILVIYSTNQSNKCTGHHWNHTKKALDKILNEVLHHNDYTFMSYMEKGYYHFVRQLQD